MKVPIILAVETSCDETAAAVIRGSEILSSVKHTQQVHKEWGGVVPALAKRDHEMRIHSIINESISQSGVEIKDVDAVAVTVGPGLAIALEVGIRHAKQWTEKLNKPIIAVNHIEGHILSALISPGGVIEFPALALVGSGGHTQLVLVEKIGSYKILAESRDDNIGEALDKGARILGLPYPGGPELEKRAALGNPKAYKLPLPMAGKEGQAFSYSGLKSAFNRLVGELLADKGSLSEEIKNDLAASYQDMVFRHFIRTVRKAVTSPLTPLLTSGEGKISDLLVGGGVIANKELKNRIHELGKGLNLRVHLPENMTLCTDNAAMIGLVGGYKYLRGEFAKPEDLDRKPRWKVDGL
jgi:N6-L-threonylcarbamoyladenine synthase